MKKLFLISLMMMVTYGLILGISTKEAAAASSNPEAETLKIGVSAPLTGAVSIVGIPHSRMTQVAADWINAKGGITIKGQKYLIELAIRDEKDTPDTAIAAATKLIELDKVKFIVGTISSLLATAVTPITEPAHIIRSLWHCEGAPIEINPKTPYTFRVSIVARDFAPVLLEYLTHTYPNAKKITMLFIDIPATQFLFEESKKKAEALGLTVLGLETYQARLADYYPLMSKVLASKPDTIFCVATPYSMGGILKSSVELGFNGPIFNLAPTDPHVVRAIAGKDAATNCIVPAPDITSPEMTPMIKEIRKMVLDKYGECSYDYIRQWDAFWWMMQAIEKAQSIDPTEVVKTWEKMDHFKASTGIGKMGGQQSYGINHIGVLPFAVTRMMKGGLEHIGWFTPKIP